MKDFRNAQTKAEAVAFVSAVMKVPRALLSPDFQKAMDVARRFEVTAGDVLEYRRKRARLAAVPR